MRQKYNILLTPPNILLKTHGKRMKFLSIPKQKNFLFEPSAKDKRRISEL